MEIETFKYCLSNNIIVLPIDNMVVPNQQKLELDETNLNILESFFPKGIDKTIKEIQKISGYSYEPVHRTLASLVKRKIVLEKKVGKTLVYSLKFDTVFAKIAFYLYATQKANLFSQQQPNIYVAIAELPEEELDILTIFGSYAKGTQSKKSDVDILCVAHKTEVMKSKILSLKHSYNIDFSPIVMDRTEFAKIKNENKEFWSDLVEFGIIFKGYDLFYSYAYLT